MNIGAAFARRDRGLVGLGFLIGGIALPWLPGPWLPTSALTTVALAFLLPSTAFATCVGQSVVAGRSRTDDEPSRASSQAIAMTTTALCSLALSLQLLVLTTMVDGPLQFPAPARAAVVLFGLHLMVVGNVLPRLRPGWPGHVSVRGSRHHAWMRTYRTAGYLCVVIGIAIVIAGARLGGTQADAVLKVALIGAAVCMIWSLRRVRTA